MSNVDASPATRKLYEAMLLVEACGASEALTAAIQSLGELDAILQADAAQHAAPSPGPSSVSQSSAEK